MKTAFLATGLSFLALSAPVLAESHMATADAAVTGRDGQELGFVRLTDTPSGQVIIEVSLAGLPAGVHAIHLHETGDCSADDFTSAGGHIAGDMAHGVMVEGGPHPGDLPNVTVHEDGRIDATHFVDNISWEDHIMDADGSAFIVHAGADDYMSQPAGDAGDRIACGEIGAS